MESENSIFCRHNFCLLVPLLPLRGYASSMKLLIAIFILVISVLISSALVNRSLAAQRYDSMRDARSDFSSALAVSAKKNRFLMVVFGADWCPDCVKLDENLKSSEVSSYMREHMDFVTIDVGRKNLNIDLALELGVTVANGIPVAVFFSPDGKQIGATNRGQLEPSRYFTSGQILKFVRAVVEQRRITQPVVFERPVLMETSD
jgi:thioredoxin 1